MDVRKVLPLAWKWVELRELSNKVHSVKRKEMDNEQQFLYFDIGSINNGTNTIKDYKEYKWKSAPSRAQQIIAKDDILFSTVRTYLKNIALVDNAKYEGQIASSGFCVIRANKNLIDPKFIFFYSISEGFLGPLSKLQTGSSYPAVRDRDVFSQGVPLPPKKIQQNIVSKIEELFRELDDGAFCIRFAQQQLITYRDSCLKEAFDRLETPEIWNVEECCSNIVDCLHSTAIFKESGYYCVDTTCISDRGILFEKMRYVSEETFFERISRLKPVEGDILFAREGTIGTTLVVPPNIELCLGQRMMMFRTRQNVIPKFFAYYFQSPSFKEQYKPLINGTTAPHLNIKDIKKLKVPIVSIERQRKIVEILDDKLSITEKLADILGQSGEQLSTLRQGILRNAFEGKLI